MAIIYPKKEPDHVSLSLDHSERWPEDQYLRRHGFAIHSRPKSGEPTWERTVAGRVRVYQQAQALVLAHRRDSQEAGCFKGAWNNIDGSESSDPRCKGSRHDMTNSSILANKLRLIDLAVAGDQILQYAGPYDEVAHSNIYFKAQG